MSVAADEIIRGYVDSSDGVRIATYEQGNPDGPTLVMPHGWPDSHVLWDRAVPMLADRFRIIRYDNRGVGNSTVPKPVSAFRMEKFADDLGAVIDALSPGQPVHVLGHDWGSVCTWEYLSRPGADERIASFTSVSGPSTDHYQAAIWDDLARPYRVGRFVGALGRMSRLTYMFPLSVPVLGPKVFGAYARRGAPLFADGLPEDKRLRGETAVTDLTNSLKIYRAMISRNPQGFRRDHYVGIPVQLIVNTEDPVVRPSGMDAVAQWTPKLWRRDIKSGHWAPMSHPQVLAQSVHELVDHLEGKPASRGLRRAQVGPKRDYFSDTLVSVTGAASGIGRATALAFAREGAELVVSDIDEAGAKTTAAEITSRGGIAHHYVLDVSDAAAVERFAADVCDEHGVPDIVVNNAGIAQAGEFLDTPAEQWDRVLDTNLGGVVNGCRAFAKRLVERGTGGHIVNVASMSAYLPQRQMNAYCTSKAAVYMFSDCLRAELDDADVGLTTICPGVVDTNIIHATQISGSPERAEHLEKRRGQIEKVYAGRRYGPEKVADAIVASVKSNKAIRPVTPEAYATYGLSRVLPRALRSSAKRRLL